MQKVRTNAHRSRTGTDKKVTNPLHNDREFDTSKAEHINEAEKNKNHIWKFDKNADEKVIDKETGQPREPTLDEYEKAYYEKYFSEQLDEKNQKKIKAGHKDRTQTIDQFRRNRLYCPEEVIFNIGDVTNRDKVTPDIMKECYEEFVKWHNEKYPNCPIIDGALHADEPNASIHIHSRQVWFTEAKSADGHLHKEIGQQSALDTMGIQPSGDIKKGERYYNSKITYTAEIRKKWAEIAEAHGFEIETTPQPESKKGRSLSKYKADKLKEELAELESRKQQTAEEISRLDKQVADLTRQTETKQTELDTLQTDVDNLSTELAQKTEAMQTVNAIQKTPRPELPPKPPEPKIPHRENRAYTREEERELNRQIKEAEKAHKEWERKELPEWEKKCKAIAAERDKWDTINAPAEAIRQASIELAEREKAVKQQAAQNRETAKNLRKQEAQINDKVTKAINQHRKNSPLLQLINKAEREYIESRHIQPQETAETVQTQEKAKAPAQARATSDNAQFRQQWAAFNAPKATPRPTAQTPTAPHTTAPKTHTTTKNKGEMER